MKQIMKTAWYQRPMRIAACQGGTDPGQLMSRIERLRAIGFNTEQLSLQPGDPAYPDYVKKAKAQGLRIIQYLNIHCLGLDQNEKNIELWAQRKADGEFHRIYQTAYIICLNSPWRDLFFKQIASLAEYELDGLFLDGPSMGAGGCFCAHCRARYAKEFGGELTESVDRFELYRRTNDDFLNEVYRRFKKINPAGVMYMNLDIMTPTVGYFKMPEALAYNDLVGTEGGFMFYGPPKNASLWRPSVCAKIMEAVVPDKPRVIFMAADQKPWSEYMHTAAETTLCIASATANGANLWYGPHGKFPSILDTPGGRAGEVMIRFMADHEAIYDSTSSAARVAVMYSMATESCYKTTITASDLYGQGPVTSKKVSGNFTESFYGFCDGLARSGIPYDVVTDLEFTLERFADYDCIILPTCACLAEKTVEALRRFAARGGALIASFDTSLYDETGKARRDFALSDVFGVSWQGRELAYGAFNYFSKAAGHALFSGIDIPLLPAPGFGLEVQPAPAGKAGATATVLARFHEMAKGVYAARGQPANPAIVLNRYRKGTCLYLAGTFGEMMNSYAPIEYRRFLENAARQFARNPVRLEGALGNVEVVVRKQRGRLIVHLINYAGLVPRPFETIMPQANLKLRVEALTRYKRARALVGNKDCPITRAGKALVAKLPPLKTYEVIVLE